MRLRGWVFVAATVVALTAVSGCGGGSEDGAERSDGYGQSMRQRRAARGR